MTLFATIDRFFKRNEKAERTGHLFGAGITACLVCMWLLFCGIAFDTYSDEREVASSYIENIAALLGQNIARDVELYDLSLQALVGQTSPAPQDNDFGTSSNARGFGTILILDKDGKVVAASKDRKTIGLIFADRDYFVAQRDGVDQSRPFIGHPFKSHVTGQKVIAVSRRRSRSDGSFDGAVVGTIKLDFLAGLFRVVKLPPDSTMALVHADGTILMRTPDAVGMIPDFRSTEVLRRALLSRSGSFVKRSRFDEVERQYAFHRAGDLPIYVSIGVPTSQIFAQWRWRIGMIALGFVILSGIVILLGLMLALELDRRTKAEKTLEILAGTDALTHLANRRRFDETLDVEWRRAVRNRLTLSLLMIDGDFFKSFNDTYGHVKGDDALRCLAAILSSCITRPSDLVARFGGEEFVVLLPDTDAHGAETVARAIRASILAANIPHIGSPYGRLTVSIGCASTQPRSGLDPAALLAAADAVLYKAKSDGRDRIIVHSSDVTGGRETQQVA